MYSTRGRPAKAGDRYPSGELRAQNDNGTPEHRAKREALTRDADDQRSGYPLGVLYARRIILQGDHWAGRRYAALYTAAVRPVAIPTILQSLFARGHTPLASALLADGVDAAKGAELRAEYLAARKVLDKLGSHVAAAVDDCAVFDAMPRSPGRIEDLKTGLDALHKHFEEADERKRLCRNA